MLARDHLQAGRLAEAIAAATAAVKADPLDTSARGLLAELLCYTGAVERADLHLEIVARQEPKAAVGIALLRQVLRGEQARQQVFGEGRAPEFLTPPSDLLRLQLAALTSLRAGAEEEAMTFLVMAEEMRAPLPGRCDGKAFDDFQDLDEIAAPLFEVITGAGKYFWVPCTSVVSIDFHRPRRPRDLIWRQATIIIRDGPEGEVFLPALYPMAPGADIDPQFRLGRATDWRGGETGPVRGLGQRMWLAGDEPVPMLGVTRLEFGET